MKGFETTFSEEALIGTPAEINWAIAIRRNTREFFEGKGVDGTAEVVFQFAKSSDFSGIPKTDPKEMAKNLINKIAKRIMEMKMASIWIKERNTTIEDRIKKAYWDILLEHKQMKKPL